MRRQKSSAFQPIDLGLGDEGPDRNDTLKYIAEMAGELAALAGAARLPMLTYFLNMARVEAEMHFAPQIGAGAAKTARR